MQLFGTAGRPLIEPRLAPLRDAVRAATAGPARIVGSAAAMLVAAWPAGEQRPAVVDAARAPVIDWVAHLGAAAAQALSLPTPLYLRAPDARPQAAAHLPRQ
jgi:tRNA threonylcarbamoyladenosine biosynthesis protein TsaB